MITPVKILCQAGASYSKKPGNLKLSTHQLSWTPKDTQPTQQPVILTSSQITGLFASKAGAAEPKLKLVLSTGANHTFAFSSAQDADLFKEKLSVIVKNNNEPPAPASTPARPTDPPSSTARPSLAPNPSRVSSSSYTAAPPPAVSTPDSRSSSIAPGRQETFELRKQVLFRSPELAALHRELVISRLITEAEFWEGRENLILAERAAQQQRRGKASQIVDPRPVRDETGNAKTVLSKQMVRDIFEEFPVVKRAFDDNVPKKLTEKEFWMRYLQSKLASRNSASARGAASEHTVKDDAIFDKYLEKEDDGVEPQRPRPQVRERLVDLAATEEDHVETGNTKDVTMQAGKEKKALPLIRRFNEHSERLLNSALGPEPQSKRRRLDFDDNVDIEMEDYGAIVLDDLQETSSSQGIALEMKDQQRYFEGGRATSSNGVESDNLLQVDLSIVLPELVQSLGGWPSSMAELHFERKDMDDAIGKMTANVRSRLDVKLRKDELPPHVLQDIRSIQSASVEFLRQFWSAVHPDQSLPPAPKAQLAAREEKMAGYLSKTQDKVLNLIQTAPQGVDPSRIEMAFGPTLAAAQRALEVHRSRIGAK